MVHAQTRAKGGSDRRVLVSNAAVNMISSLYPRNKTKADATLAAVKSSVLDADKALKVAGIDNAYVARTNGLRVIFKTTGDSVVITSVAAEA